MCPHSPECPAVENPDREAAKVISCHPEQGWSLLCNGLIAFEDTGNLLPDCSVVAPHRANASCRPGTGASGCLPLQSAQRARGMAKSHR
jgi:hypothetical protein